MYLSFALSDIIRVPFGYLLDWLYQFTSNYGVALILFAILVKVILLPISAKSKKSMMKMSRMTPRLQEIQNKYANDKQKQSEAMAALYKEEGVSMGGGCLWGFIPLLILLPLYQVIRQPIVYMLHQDAETVTTIVNVVKEHLPDLFTQRNMYYEQILAAGNMEGLKEAIQTALPNLSAAVQSGIDFNFLGVNLGQVIVGSSWAWNWNHIGAALIPILSAGSQVLQMWVTQKMNDSVVTNKDGIQDQETAKKSQANQTNKVMMWMMPLFSLWIGFTIPVALSLYWLIQGVASIIIDAYLTKKYRKIYDAEDAERLKKHMAELAIEEEKERVRAERRAANPEGITDNTSKKKLQKLQQQQEEAAKLAAKKEYQARKGIVEEEKSEADTTLSGISSRPYCKGRAYDPSHYKKTEE